MARRLGAKYGDASLVDRDSVPVEEEEVVEEEQAEVERPERHYPLITHQEEDTPTVAPVRQYPEIPFTEPQPKDPWALWQQQGRGGVQQQTATENNSAVVGVLSGLIVFLSLLFLVLVIPPFCRSLQQRIPVSKKRIKRRYETIEGWLISKVRRAYDD